MSASDGLATLALLELTAINDSHSTNVMWNQSGTITGVEYKIHIKQRACW